jgi:hypothetical protein
MQTAAAQCAGLTDLYRDGEVERMLRRVEQLDREMPLQTMQVQIPYENTLGGFEIFHQGLTDLGPELIGWYGESGIDPSRDTVLFLMGDGFSVHDTVVLAGGALCQYDLVSRQVMVVTVPPGVDTVDGRNVDVHVATPYGISNHLLVPVRDDDVSSPDVTPPAWAERAVLSMYWKAEANNLVQLRNHTPVQPPRLIVSLPPTMRAAAPLRANLVFHLSHDDEYLGTLTLADVPLNPQRGRYSITGSLLQTLIGANDASGLRRLVQPYAQWLFDQEILREELILQLHADLTVDNREIEIEGALQVEVHHFPPAR